MIYYLLQLRDELFLFLAGTSLRDSDAELAHGVHGPFETEPFHGYVIIGGRLGHQAANEVVSDEEHFQFLMHHLRTLAAQQFHAHGGFDVAKPQFNLPAPGVEFGKITWGR